jgi:hypothetical protein
MGEWGDGMSLVISQWSVGSEVSKLSKAAWMHDCMVGTNIKHLPQGHHLLNLSLNLNLVKMKSDFLIVLRVCR